MPAPFEIESVPDFSGPHPAVFEARSLLFLAAFCEYGGAARHFPLHLACIGEPPKTVRWLAERSGATLHAYPPKTDGPRGMANKMRGLELAASTTQRL